MSDNDIKADTDAKTDTDAKADPNADPNAKADPNADPNAKHKGKLTLTDLILMGLANIVGAGIFVIICKSIKYGGSK